MVTFLDDSQRYQREHPQPRHQRWLRRARLIMVVHRRAVVAGLLVLAALIGVQMMRPRATPVPTELVWVAAADLPSGQVLGPQQVRAQAIPTALIPAPALRVEAGNQQWLNRVVGTGLASGEVLTPVRLLGPALLAQYGQPGSAQEAVAVPVRIVDARLLLGVRVGQHLDLYATPQGRGTPAQRVAQAVTVLVLPGQAGSPEQSCPGPASDSRWAGGLGEAGGTSSSSPGDGAVIMVAAPSDQAGALAAANASTGVWPTLTSPNRPPMRSVLAPATK